MKNLNLAVVSIVAALAQPCFAESTNANAAQMEANAKQHLQTYQSITPVQQQAARLSAMQKAEGMAQQNRGAMAAMRSNMQGMAGGFAARSRK